jgi:hypothetical protein
MITMNANTLYSLRDTKLYSLRDTKFAANTRSALAPVKGHFNCQIPLRKLLNTRRVTCT